MKPRKPRPSGSSRSRPARPGSGQGSGHGSGLGKGRGGGSGGSKSAGGGGRGSMGRPGASRGGPAKGPGGGRPPGPPRPHRRTTPAPTISTAGGEVPEEFTDASRGVRLQKALAQAGVASRRECEQLIADGRVMVNGQRVTGLPAWVDPRRDRIEVDGTAVRKQTPGSGSHTYLMLYKPRRVLSTTRDDLGRKGVTDLVEITGIGAGPRLFPVGRLDAQSTGLILLTNDGELANRITHPSFGVTKEYWVSVKGDVTEEDLERLRKGLFLAHQGTGERRPRVKKAAVEDVQILKKQRDRSQGDRTVLKVVLQEGQNREIRRMIARLGYSVRRLQRMAIGPVRLKGVASGNWRPLTPAELRSLRQAVGLASRGRAE